ncbi:hypothetical protein [Candidatus Pantoea carbekii]|nr:hypothetical protein [Candidatus Pantoea carbekii]
MVFINALNVSSGIIVIIGYEIVMNIIRLCYLMPFFILVL